MPAFLRFSQGSAVNRSQRSTRINKGMKLTLLALTLTALFSFVGCSKAPLSIGKQVSVSPSENARETSNPESLLDGPFAFVAQDQLHITLAGSSSCPPTPISSDMGTDDTLTIEVSSTQQTQCTADMASITYRLAVDPLPSQVRFVFKNQVGDSEVTVSVASDDW